MAVPIVNYVRARTAFLPILLADSQASAETATDVEAWLTILPPGERELSASAETGGRTGLHVTYRAEVDDVPEGWTLQPALAAAEALLPARSYQLGGQIASGSGFIPLPTAIVKIKEL